MKILVLYDSTYGNTAIVATTIRKALSVNHEVSQKSIKELTPPNLDEFDLLILGSPTQGGKPTKAMENWIAETSLFKGMMAAVFDTRFHEKDQGFALRLLMKMIGYAANKMAASLRVKGARIIDEPIGFIVNDKKGPLKDDELERAHDWALRVVSAIPEPAHP